jgi:hypothetical protein
LIRDLETILLFAYLGREGFQNILKIKANRELEEGRSIPEGILRGVNPQMQVIQDSLSS